MPASPRTERLTRVFPQQLVWSPPQSPVNPPVTAISWELICPDSTPQGGRVHLVPTAARAPSDLWLRLLYLGLQLPLIFWLQDTRPGLGQLGAKDVRQQGRQAAESRVPGGMCCRAAEPQ